MCHICGIHPSIQVHTILYSGATAIKSTVTSSLCWQLTSILAIILPQFWKQNTDESLSYQEKRLRNLNYSYVCAQSLQSCPTLCNPIACQAPLFMRFFPGKNIGVGCHFLLQGILPTQGSNLYLLHFRMILYCRNTPGVQITVDLL